MTPSDDIPERIRITLAFDGAAPDLDALDALARLAAALSAELNGLFIEDQNLLRLAALPVAREYSRHGAPRALAAADMERQLQRQAEALRAAVMRTAERAGVQWTFGTARGSLGREVVGVVAQCQAIAVALTAPASNLFDTPLSARRVAPHTIAAVYAGTSGSRRALALALRLCETLSRPLTVLLSARTEKAVNALSSEVRQALGGQRAHIVTASDLAPAALVLAARGLEAALMVLEAGDQMIAPDAIAYLNERLPCPALLVR